MTRTPQDPRTSNTYSHTVAVLETAGRGELLAEADKALTEVTNAVIRRGKKGKVVLEIAVEPQGSKDDEIRGIAVACKVKASAPQVEMGKSFFFTDARGQLTRTPPADELSRSFQFEGNEE